MPILDYLGRPVQTKSLTNELAAPSLGGVRQAWYDSVATGLTPEKLAAILAAVDRNDIYDYLTLAMEMEERDGHYSSVLRTRKLAVSGLSVTVDAFSDKRKDVKVADAVRELVTCEAFEDLISDQLDAIGKGFSVSEIMWGYSDKEWYPEAYIWRDQRFFQFDRETGMELRLRTSESPMEGVELAPYKFVQHRPKLKTGMPIRGGLARLAAVSFMCKGYSLKDWLAFAEVFGMPIRVGKFLPGASAEQKMELLRAVSMVGTDAACIIPDNMSIDFIESAKANGGDNLFSSLANWLDSQVSKAVLGQTMTTDDGSSRSQAEVHNDVRSDIQIDDAKKLAATLRRDVIKPFVDLNFGQRPDKEYPKLRLVYEEPEDLKLLSEALPPFINLGLRVEESVIRDKFGLPEPAEDAVLLGAQAAQPEVDGEDPEAEGEEDDAEEKDPKAEGEEPDDEEDADEEEPKDDVAKLRAEVRKLQIALNQRNQPDAIDDLADKELKGWKKVMDPVLEPLLALAAQSSSFEELQEKLKGAGSKMDFDQLVKVVALLTFKARGLGDATDKVR